MKKKTKYTCIVKFDNKALKLYGYYKFSIFLRLFSNYLINEKIMTTMVMLYTKLVKRLEIKCYKKAVISICVGVSFGLNTDQCNC